jgi:hypothetical protein
MKTKFYFVLYNPWFRVKNNQNDNINTKIL